jgi:hypothetical protein
LLEALTGLRTTAFLAIALDFRLVFLMAVFLITLFRGAFFGDFLLELTFFFGDFFAGFVL